MDRGILDHRARLLDGAAGRLIEVGAGTGSNFSHYPEQVTAALAVEPEPHLRTLAAAAAGKTTVPVEVVDGVADRLPAADRSIDVAVACLVLCTVPDPQAALAELFRVLRPGGQLRFFEHVQHPSPSRRRVQRLADATIWPLLNGGCHTARDTLTAIQRAGFAIDDHDRYSSADTRMPFPSAPQILGTATRPTNPEGRP
ncbi:ubiquinone/menaquinone biosynthesis C-methylase UbiE [Lipingzhangella halophila]|uniref:Ubiquinone/menaquinone biosynthesis C-methylase UbiE n=1 Tax=Lipingzhangella halophila TaxID=1783352 RepID=A0A7W7RFU0_9ACTN|nr:class I SAM-dependent methyltransferase [Lipingzhangella halophila]MBB4931117.1 ubiquinone/menaquinone biosynthesis C-methylase UbiE [Lipingzhangella halophila]